MSETKQGSIFDLQEYKQYRRRWDTRVRALTVRAQYYDGSIYNKFREMFPSSVYSQVKPLYLPLSRAVDVDAGIIPAGWAFPEDAPDAWIEGRDALFADSMWKTKGVLYVHYGAQGGLSGLKIVDMREEGKAIIAPIDPATFMLVRRGPYHPVELGFVIEDRIDEEGETYEYAEVYTKELIKTYKDGKPFAYDEENGRKEEYVNEQGQIPFVETKHFENGKELSEATFEKAIPILNETNKLASWMAEIIKKNADPQWAGFGVEPSELDRSGDVMWFVNDAGARIEAIVPQIMIDQALKFVETIAQNAKDALPELAFDELRRKDQIATPTLELQLAELVLKIKRTRPNYDDGLVRAMQMAGKAAQTMDGKGDTLKLIAALDDPELVMDDDREVLPMDPKTLLELDILRQQRDQAEALARVPIGDEE